MTRSACYFVVRMLTDPDVPASSGAFEPVTVTAPHGCLVNARSPAAVAAGNTETSSRIMDVVMAAFGEALPVPAQGQGTMNNVVLGDDRFAYYETIGGGQGGCPDAGGPSAVHVAMSNARNTPIEALEQAYPVRVERYALRLGSGGAGRGPAGTASCASCGCLPRCGSRSSRSGGSCRREELPAAATVRPAAPSSTAWSALRRFPSTSSPAA